MSGASDRAWPFCAGVPAVDIPIGSKGARWNGVDARTADAWRAAAAILEDEGFDPDFVDTGAYVCRNTNVGTPSPHGRRIAADSDWQENAAWARGSIPRDRFAHTTFTPRMIERILAIRTNSGVQVFEWGGFWRTYYDPMHLQINCTPADLATGIAGAPLGDDDEMLSEDAQKFVQRELANQDDRIVARVKKEIAADFKRELWGSPSKPSRLVNKLNRLLVAAGVKDPEKV